MSGEFVEVRGRSPAAEATLDAAETLTGLVQMFGADGERGNREGVRAVRERFYSRLMQVSQDEQARMLAEVRAAEKRFTVPDEHLNRGDVVQTSEGQYGMIVMHGFDAEGSYGYLVSTGRHRDTVWRYHHPRLIDEGWAFHKIERSTAGAGR